MRSVHSMGQFLRRAAFTLLLAASALPAAAGAIVLGERMPGVAIGTQVELLEDPQGALALDDVRSGPASRRFQPSTEDNVSLGYRDSVLWIRIRFERGTALGPWMLEVSYPLLDEVRLFAPNLDTPGVAGDHVRVSQRPLADRNLLFPVASREPGENVYLLRVQQSGAMSVPLRIWDAESLGQAKRDEMFLLGAYFGLLGVMVLYNLVIFAIVRDRAYAHYGVYVSAMGLLVAVNNGFGSLVLWPEAPAIAIWMQAITPPLTCATAAVFSRHFLLTPTHAPRIDRALLAIAVVGFALIPLGAFIPRTLAFWTNHTLAAATIVVTCLAGFVSWRSGYRPAGFYLFAFLSVSLGALLMAARNIGAESSLLTDYGIQFGSALGVALLSMGLADRIAILRRVETDRAEALEALNRSLQAEMAERERTESLLRESEERMRHQAQHDPLTGLPNRLLLRDRLVQATARAKRDRTTFAVLLVDLDHFKLINDTLGHDVGDLLLVEVAKRLASCTRERDTIARLGGDEFVLVLEGLAAPEDSALVARKVVEVLSSPFGIAGELLRTGPSIGISLYPADGQDPDFLLKFADIAMYRAKAAGRNCYRFYADPEQLHAYDQKVQ